MANEPMKIGDSVTIDGTSYKITAEEGDFMGQWPNCDVPDCENKSCLRLKSTKCYPHTMQARTRREGGGRK